MKTGINDLFRICPKDKNHREREGGRDRREMAWLDLFLVAFIYLANIHTKAGHSKVC